MKICDHLHLVGSEQFALSHLLDCNCYLIDAGGSLALIDTGTGMGVESILANIESAGFNPSDLTHILVTHAHLGHWGGAPGIREATGAEIWAPQEGRYWMEHIDEDVTIIKNFEYGRYPQDFKPEPCTPDRTFTDGEHIPIGDSEIQAITVQGHTKDSTCYVCEIDGKKALFSGDVVFYAGLVGIINAPGCSLDDYRRDMPKIVGLGVDMLFPGHGVFILNNGQKHIDRAQRKLSDFVLPDTFFEGNEFMWEQDYRSSLE